MAGKLKKAQSKVEQAFDQTKVFRKYGGKFKYAFSSKKQSPAQSSNTACVQDVHCDTTVRQMSSTQQTEQTSVTNRPSLSSKDVVVREKSRVSADTYQAFPAFPLESNVTPLDFGAHESEPVEPEAPFEYAGDIAVSTSGKAIQSSSFRYSTPNPVDSVKTKRLRNALRRTTSLPAPSSSQSTTPISQNTLSPIPLMKSHHHQLTHNHADPTDPCTVALSQHRHDDEEPQNQQRTAEWAALLQRITSAHAAEIRKLGHEHAVQARRWHETALRLCRRVESQSDELEGLKRQVGKFGKVGEGLGRGKGDGDRGVTRCGVAMAVGWGITLAWVLRRPGTFY